MPEWWNERHRLLSLPLTAFNQRILFTFRICQISCSTIIYNSTVGVQFSQIAQRENPCKKKQRASNWRVSSHIRNVRKINHNCITFVIQSCRRRPGEPLKRVSERNCEIKNAVFPNQCGLDDDRERDRKCSRNTFAHTIKTLLCQNHIKKRNLAMCCACKYDGSMNGLPTATTTVRGTSSTCGWLFGWVCLCVHFGGELFTKKQCCRRKSVCKRCVVSVCCVCENVYDCLRLQQLNEKRPSIHHHLNSCLLAVLVRTTQKRSTISVTIVLSVCVCLLTSSISSLPSIKD